ncbi:MAG: ethanolamine ammonia-lyase, partial [Oligoflexales bacterium]|nr:ethanolamine ammonia-lyase [Oligoflexales bacterium]
KARTKIGVPGTLSFRLQPNHPTDNLDAITLLIYNDLAMGMGDCLIGVNPAEDTVENVSALLHHIDKIRRSLNVPTQVCVLGHIKTQLSALSAGAPVEILFQSLAGTSATLTGEFDVTIELLDKAYGIMKESGPLRDVADQFMYFETGQGSEVTYNRHNGMDMTTCEALCYGICRRYDPFMVNNATGFIGPETHLEDFELIIANLQDLFMGKLMGLPMGISPSYTMHSKTHREGQQIATQVLAAAGANYFMDVYLGTDRMLAHFVNSGHDDQTLREVHGRLPAPEFLEWCFLHDIFRKNGDGRVVRGAAWGNPRIFCPSDSEFQRLKENLPLAFDFKSAGPRPTDRVARSICANQAVTRMAINSQLDMELFKETGIPFRLVDTMAQNRESYLANPDVGCQLSDKSMGSLKAENNDIQVIVSDGLSAEAIHHNIPNLLPVLRDGLSSRHYKVGENIIVPYGRVKVAEAIAGRVKSRLAVMLIGERPGGGSMASKSMSAYLVYHLMDPEEQKLAARFSGNRDIMFEYTLITNIYDGGLPAAEAGSLITEKAFQILEYRAAGNRLQALLSASSK